MEAKPRLVGVTKAEVAEIGKRVGELDAPLLYAGENGSVWADADELRRWRASQHTSGEQR